MPKMQQAAAGPANRAAGFEDSSKEPRHLLTLFGAYRFLQEVLQNNRTVITLFFGSLCKHPPLGF